MVKALVNAGASLAVPSVSDTMGAVAANAGSTPLHLAAMKVRMRVTRALYDVCCCMQSWCMMGPQLLVNAGASLAVPSVSDTMGAVAANAGSTPLHLAAMKVRCQHVNNLCSVCVSLFVVLVYDGHTATGQCWGLAGSAKCQ